MLLTVPAWLLSEASSAASPMLQFAQLPSTKEVIDVPDCDDEVEEKTAAPPTAGVPVQPTEMKASQDTIPPGQPQQPVIVTPRPRECPSSPGSALTPPKLNFSRLWHLSLQDTHEARVGWNDEVSKLSEVSDKLVADTQMAEKKLEIEHIRQKDPSLAEALSSPGGLAAQNSHSKLGRRHSKYIRSDRATAEEKAEWEMAKHEGQTAMVAVRSKHFEKTKSNLLDSFQRVQVWWRKEYVKGTYKGFWQMVKDHGGSHIADVVEECQNMVEACIILGGDWKKWNSRAQRWDFLDVEEGFIEEYNQKWPHPQNSTNQVVTKVML